MTESNTTILIHLIKFLFYCIGKKTVFENKAKVYTPSH